MPQSPVLTQDLHKTWRGMMQWLWVSLCLFGWPLGQADASNALKQGEAYYQSYQFGKAIIALNTAVTAAKVMPKDQRLKAYVLLASSYYNLAQLKQARTWYHKALALDANATLPKGQAPNVYEHFAKLKAAWRKQNPPKVRPAARRTAARATPSRRNPPPRRVTRRAPPRPRTRIAVRPTTPSPKSASGFRHIPTIVLLGAALVAGGVAIGAGVVHNGHLDRYQQQLADRRAFSGAQLESTHRDAQTMGILATVSMISAGTLAAAGIITLIVIETQRPKVPATPPSQ